MGILDPSMLCSICRVIQGHILHFCGIWPDFTIYNLKNKNCARTSNTRTSSNYLHCDHIVDLITSGVLPGVMCSNGNQGLSIELWSVIRLLPFSWRYILFKKKDELYKSFKI